MAMTNRLNDALRHLQQDLAPPGDPPDGELLARFVAARDEGSFAVLVRRHGPMVLGVCRRVLRHHQDAEDAFQAAFLVLARKAAVVRPEAVAAYLHAVAYRTALEARGVNARRRAREMQVEDLPQTPIAPAEAQDWRPVLDRELGRLPEKYRRLIVLCDLAGRSRKEVAGQLGLAEGTLSSRLAAARQMLARRLTRCGVTLSAGVLAAGFSEEAAASVPVALLDSTARYAALVAGGHAALTTPAAVLMQGVLKAMFLKKLTFALGMALAALVLGAGGLAFRAAGQDGAAGPKLEELVERLAEVHKQRADLEKQEKKLVTAIGAEARKQGQTRPTAVVSEREGKLLFVGTEVKAGESVPEDRLVKPDPTFACLVVAAWQDGKVTKRPWKEGDIIEPTECSVTLQPKRVRKLQVGDKVECGQLIALVSPSLAASKLSGALAKLQSAHAELMAAGKVRDTTKRIYDDYSDALRRVPGSIPQVDYFKSRLDYVKAVEEEKVKASLVRSARADTDEAAILLGMHEVRSAVAGVIIAIDKRPGEMVKIGDTVLQVREP
jgi:RNA polymerase sigma factor (sigma-70 family)